MKERGASEDFRFAIDLYDHGFAWEAHAYWEAMWHAAGREGELADTLRALVKIAAARVKLAQKNLRGVRSHLEGALDLLRSLAAEHLRESFGLGLDLVILEARVSTTLEYATSLEAAARGPVFTVALGAALLDSFPGGCARPSCGWRS